MARCAGVLACLVLLVGGGARQQPPATTGAQPDLPVLLAFEGNRTPGALSGWRGNPPDQVFADGTIVHGGRWSGRLEGDPSKGPSTVIIASIPLDFSGGRIELRGFLKTEGVKEVTGLWLRQDAGATTLALENMVGRGLSGTTDWARYSVSMASHPEGRQLFFGVHLQGAGKVWVDDLELLVDGKPVWEAPRAERPKTVLELDREFAAGSRVVLDSLAPHQIENLCTLGKVWGFLKYHHPRIAAGAVHWDFELFRVLPAVLSARDRSAATKAMAAWLEKLGPVADCQTCAVLDPAELHLRPEMDWLSGAALLGDELSAALQHIYRNRPTRGPQFYVSQRPQVENPAFDHEPGYPTADVPDAGYRLLAVYRFWNIIRYWFPYRDVIGEDWEDVLGRFIPRVALAKSRIEYERELMALIASVNDTHANLWSSLDSRPPSGDCSLPIHVRFVEKLPVIVATNLIGGRASGLEIADVITELDGTPVARLIDEWRPYYAASNEPKRLLDIARTMGRGACGETTVGIRRGSRTVTVRTLRVKTSAAPLVHDLPGETFRLLAPDVAYLKLSSIKVADLPRYIDRAAGTRGLIVDIRNYPSEFVVFALGSLLIDKPVEFARFTAGDLANPGAFRWRGTPLVLRPGRTRYSGKVIVLLDEVSLSQAEYTAMAFRAAGATVVGSTTAGADGNVSQIPLPGGVNSMISGIGVFYPDKRPTQRVGIVPDIEARPTIAGIAAGREEVLEVALRQILGQGTPAAEIERIARDARAGSPASRTP